VNLRPVAVKPASQLFAASLEPVKDRRQRSAATRGMTIANGLCSLLNRTKRPSNFYDVCERLPNRTEACLDRKMQSGIDTGLANRYDFSKHFEHFAASGFPIRAIAHFSLPHPTRTHFDLLHGQPIHQSPPSFSGSGSRTSWAGRRCTSSSGTNSIRIPQPAYVVSSFPNSSKRSF
jgi:hypothetical protein